MADDAIVALFPHARVGMNPLYARSTALITRPISSRTRGDEP